MTLALVVVGVLAVMLPGMRPCLSLRGDPRWFVRLDALALGFGAIAVTAGLAASAVLVPALLAMGNSPRWYGTHLVPGGAAASLLSAAALGVVGARTICFWRRLRRARRAVRVEGWLGRHEHCGDHDVVFVPAPEPVAYSVHGERGQVVVTDGLASALSAEALSLVIAHERAHLRRRHGRYLALAALVEAIGGGIGPVSRASLALRLAVERAADEEAAGADLRDRLRLASALRRLAMTSPAGRADGDALRYRARLLRSTPGGGRPGREVVAAVGIVALLVLSVFTTAHLGSEVPALVAAAR